MVYKKLPEIYLPDEQIYKDSVVINLVTSTVETDDEFNEIDIVEQKVKQIRISRENLEKILKFAKAN